MAKWKRQDLDFKRRAVEQMRSCENITALAGKLKLTRSLLYKWKGQLEGHPDARRADLSQTAESATEKKLREENRMLKEALGEKALEADFFAGALRRIEALRRGSAGSGETASTRKSVRGRNQRKAK